MQSNQNKITRLWMSKEFQMAVDVARILLVVLMIIILYILITEIEAVKLLGSDVCKICMNKTGCTCWCMP